MSDEAPEPEQTLYLDMDFGEAMARFAQTKASEVEPPKRRVGPQRNRKKARPDPKTKPGDPVTG
jgi:thymidylate kinase